MNNFGKRALCLLTVIGLIGLLASPVLADNPWTEDPPQKGKPEEPVIPTMGPSCYGQLMMLDEFPWGEKPPQNGKPEDPIIPTISPSAWWMQPAVDEHGWIEDPPRKNSPKE